MPTLFHHPFCPHSRFVRIAAGEYGLNLTLIEERPWERRDEFLVLNPAGTTPVLLEEGRPPVPGAAIIAEYLDETRGDALNSHRLLPADIGGRVEVRRLLSWFNDKFFAEVSGPLVMERVLKRRMSPAQGGGPPEPDAIRASLSNIRYHLDYISWLVRTKKNQLPGRADERDRARFAKAKSYMLRRDDMMACKNMRCRKRFEISGVQSVVFTD